MPSTTANSVSRDLASSIVMTPSLPTFFIALARKRPISASPLAEIVPTWAISSFRSQFGLERFGLLDRDDTLIANLLHRVGQEAPDLGIAVGRNRADLGDLLIQISIRSREIWPPRS